MKLVREAEFAFEHGQWNRARYALQEALMRAMEAEVLSREGESE